MADGALAPTPFKLNAKQIEKRALIATSATHILDFGGSRGGKTFGWLYAMVARAVLAPGSRHLSARYRYNAVKRSIRLDTFPKVMRLAYPGVRWTPHDQDGYVKIHTGHGEPSELWFGGLDSQERVDKVLGQEYATIFTDEVSEVEHEAILTLRTRLAQKALIAHGPRKGEPLRLKGFYSLNPTSRRHWSYQEFISGLDPAAKGPLKNPRDFARMITPPSDNITNLPPGYLEFLQGLPRIQRARFWEGKYLEDVEGALWRQNMYRRVMAKNVPPLRRKVVAVDPSGAQHAKDVSADEIGIVVAGEGIDGRGYLLEDLSMRAGPSMWANAVVSSYRRHEADAIVFEANYGGPMGKALIHSIDPRANVKMVHATRAKHVRAEPVAGLYERGLVVHVGAAEDWEDLEDQYGQFTTAGWIGSGSPDRADAAVWALTELMLKSARPADASGGANDW